MATAPPPFRQVIDDLGAFYGRPIRSEPSGVLELILWENVAYLAGDGRRAAAYRALEERVGTRPDDILQAPDALLLEITSLGGILARKRVDKLRAIADTARELSGEMSSLRGLPLRDAKRALKRFPSIGDPGAEKVLLFTRAHAVLALESNGLRVLLRLGFGEERKSYSATYRSAQEALKGQLPEDCSWLIRAHLLLRRHGQELCKRSAPRCEACPLSRGCRYYGSRS